MSRTQSPDSLTFKVRRSSPELVTPAKPTPHEFKPLSDMDNQNCLRVHVPSIQFYSHNPFMNGVDPVEIIRKAIAQTLVFYYPFAGRLREDHGRKLIVECNGEGILFVEADADVTLDQFDYPLVPPFPYSDQLLLDFPGSTHILNSPLMLVQVTRLKCGGFIFALRYNHTMSDAPGLVQFMSAIGEMARGAIFPSVFPKWDRHVLSSRSPLQVQYDDHVSNTTNDLKSTPEPALCYRAFFFGPTEILDLRRRVPDHLRHCSSFEIVNACVWRCRVVALQPHPTEEMTMSWSVNLRSKLKHLIPDGYYGNAVGLSTAKSTARDIIENPFSYALQLVVNAKHEVSEDYDRSLSKLVASKGCYLVSDLKHLRFEKVDFGWSKAIYGGPIFCVPIGCCPAPLKNGIVLPLCFTAQVMERFEKELNNVLKDEPLNGDKNTIVSLSKL